MFNPETLTVKISQSDYVNPYIGNEQTALDIPILFGDLIRSDGKIKIIKLYLLILYLVTFDFLLYD